MGQNTSREKSPTDAYPLPDKETLAKARAREEALAREREEAQKRENEKHRQKRSVTTLAVRNVKKNPDLLLFGLAVFICVCFGYCIARVKYGLTAEQIKVGIEEFVYVIIAFVTGVAVIIGKLHTKAGTLARKWSNDTERPDNEVDEYQRTITPR